MLPKLLGSFVSGCAGSGLDDHRRPLRPATVSRTVNPLDGKVNNKIDDKKYDFFNKFSSNLQRITMPRADTLQARHSW